MKLRLFVSVLVPLIGFLSGCRNDQMETPPPNYTGNYDFTVYRATLTPASPVTVYDTIQCQGTISPDPAQPGVLTVAYGTWTLPVEPESNGDFYINSYGTHYGKVTPGGQIDFTYRVSAGPGGFIDHEVHGIRVP